MRPDIGIETVVLADGVDMTRMFTGFTNSNPAEAVQSTRFRAADFSHEFIAALRSSGIALTGYHPVTMSAEIEEFLQQVRALKRNGQEWMIGLGGMTPGNLVLMAKAIQTSFGSNFVTDALITAEADFQVTSGSPGLSPGVSLLSPSGGDVLAAIEGQSLVFTNAPADLELVFRGAGTSEVSTAFKPSDSNVTIKARIQELAAYAGQTVTSTGSLTTSTDGVTGETLYSGTRSIAFSMEADVPQLEVLAGEQQRLVVTTGDYSPYTLNGGADFTLGASAATIQTNQRALAGSYAAVVVKGVSVAPPASRVVVAGAGTAEANGTFFENGTNEGRPLYLLGAAEVFYSASFGWFIGSRTGGYWYQAPSSQGSLTPPSTGWQVGGTGVAPAPTVSYTSATSNGSATLNSYFPYSVGNVANPSSTGTGDAVSTIHQGGADAGAVVVESTTAGGSDGSEAVYNVLTATGNETPVNDTGLAAATTNGLDAMLQVLAPVGSTPSLTVKVQHAPDVTGSPGTWADLFTFDAVTEAGVVRKTVAADVSINPHLRAVVQAITGSWVAAVGIARR